MKSHNTVYFIVTCILFQMPPVWEHPPHRVMILTVEPYGDILGFHILKEGTTEEMNEDMAFYTAFCGHGRNKANAVKDAPSKTHKCFYFSDNRKSLKKARKKGWIPVELHGGVPLKDIIESNMRAKHLKVVPHRYKELQGFRYLVYSDAGTRVDENQIIDVINNDLKNSAYFLKLHPFNKADVWDEFLEAMHQPRYRTQKEMMKVYIEEQMTEKGLSFRGEYMFWCCFMLRDTQHPLYTEINETWMSHIQKCGIEDQVSFFFIYQIFHEHIQPDLENKITFS